MIDLTKEEREFIYDLLNQTLILGVDHNRTKADIMEKMDVEKEEEKNSA